MSRAYVEARLAARSLLEATEQHLATLADGTSLRRDDFRRLVADHRATDHEVSLVIAAMVNLGTLKEAGSRWKLGRKQLEASQQYRLGVKTAMEVHDALALSGARTNLVVTVPPSTNAPLREFFAREASDLRASVIDLIASARERVVLASPFWDEETADDLRSLLRRRISNGVHVDLLGREFGGPTGSGLALQALAENLGSGGCRAYTWFRVVQGERFGSETFHFKLAIADGSAAYLGTANFTESGFRSRMELGVVTRGPLAQSLQRIVDSLLGKEL